EVAHRLGITRVTSTDFVRQTMRAFFSREFMPSIHYSSFEAGQGLPEEEQETGDPTLLGFLEQTRNVLVGVNASIERALEEGWSMVLRSEERRVGKERRCRCSPETRKKRTGRASVGAAGCGLSAVCDQC